MGWKHYQKVDPRKREPQVARGLFGIRILILHFKFQFSKSIKSLTFHIFLNLTYPLRKNISFPKCPKITQKFTQNRQTVVNEISREILCRLKRDRDIGRKAVLRRLERVFRCYIACETMEDYKEGCLMVWANYMSPCNSIIGLYFKGTCDAISVTMATHEVHKSVL